MKRYFMLLFFILIITLGAGCDFLPASPSADNNIPVITSSPVTSAIVGVNYTYNVEANDEDGDTLVYSLTTKPPGMTIDSSTRLISWTPSAEGDYSITVKVSDGKSTVTQSFTVIVSEISKSSRVVMMELFEGPACSHCREVYPAIVRLRQEYGFDELVILEEYGWDTSAYTGWGIKDVRDRYYRYFDYVGSDKGNFPAAFLNGVNQFVYYNDGGGYANYKAAIEAELAKPAKIAISASYNVSGKIVNINGNIINVSSDNLSNLVVEAMVYEDSVYLDFRQNYVDVVRDIITHGESGSEGLIASFAPGESHEFSLTSSSLSNVHDMSNIHVVVYVQAPNSPTKEILQALYVE